MTIQIRHYDVSKEPQFANEVMDLLVDESTEVWRIGIDRKHVLSLLSDNSKAGTIIATDGIKVVGAFIVVMSSVWYNPSAKCARDLLIWVHPAYRGGSIFVRMLHCVEQFVKEKGIPMIYLSQSTGIDTEKTARLYSKMGYKVTGFLSVKEF